MRVFLLEIIASPITSRVICGTGMRIEVTVQQITDKIHSIRNYYPLKKREVEAASKKPGSGRDHFVYN